MKHKTPLIFLGLYTLSTLALAEPKPQEPKKSIVDEVVWMVGDEPILLSDI